MIFKKSLNDNTYHATQVKGDRGKLGCLLSEGYAFWKGWTMVLVRYKEALTRNTYENKVEACGNKMYRTVSTKTNDRKTAYI